MANAITTKAEAKARAIELVGDSLKTAQGSNAASFNIAEQYVKAFSNLAQTNNTLIMSSDASDVAKMSAHAMQIYKTLSNRQISSGEFQTETQHGSDIEEYYSDAEAKNTKKWCFNRYEVVR